MSQFIRNRTLAVAAWTRLVRIHQKVDKASEKNFHSLGLSQAWFDVLARVGAREGLCQGDLAATLLVTKGNVSQLIVKMETDGLIERRADGRSQRLYLTPRGRVIHDEAVPQQERLLAESCRGLSHDETHELVRLLRKWENS